jgi:protein-tyrosine-phosphatase
MDLDNRKALLKLAKSQAEKEKIFMLASFDPKLDKIDPDGDDAHLLAIPDPYGKELAAYRQVLEMIERSSDGLISWLNS